jgi:hypothetical protein
MSPNQRILSTAGRTVRPDPSPRPTATPWSCRAKRNANSTSTTEIRRKAITDRIAAGVMCQGDGPKSYNGVLLDKSGNISDADFISSVIVTLKDNG